MFIEQKTIWEYLSETDRPIVIYGMGNGADKIIDMLQSVGAKVSDIFASDEYVRGHSFRGHRVLKYSEICEKYSDCIVLVAFAAFKEDLLQKIYSIGEKYELLAPHVPLFGHQACDRRFISDNSDNIEKVYEMLADEQSKKCFSGVLNFMISGKISYLQNCTTDRDEVFRNIIKLGDGESYADLGAYNGDTVEEFLQLTGGKFRHITALEPDKKNYRKLFAKFGDRENIELLQNGIWNEATELIFDGRGGRNSSYGDDGYTVRTESIDRLFATEEVTYIKMDVEGAETEALNGGKNVLAHKAPKLAVSAYHHTEDIIKLPLLIKSLNPSYAVYLRHHPYIPAFETNIYAVKQKKY